VPVELVIVEADGGSRGNPGPGGYGAVVLDPESGEVLAERSGSLGATTNNIAEYSGLIAGLEAAAELGARRVEVRMDSKLVVEQVSGRWQTRNPGLRPLRTKAAALIEGFEAVRLQWVPRSRNTRADALANAAMDAAGAKSGDGDASGVVVADRPDRRSVTAGVEVRHWTPPTGQATRLILVRHGETALSVERRFSGRGDAPLTERGQAQALATAARLSAMLRGDSVPVVSSALTRARQTAEEIVAMIGRGILTVEDRLVECDFGDWEGHTFAEVRQRWPGELDAWLGSTTVAPPGGESFDQVAARLLPAFEELRESHPGQDVVVVGHVTGIKLLLRHALDAGPRFLHRLHLDPAGISVVDNWVDGGISVRLVNDTSHLAGIVT
jgi:probable phosphoglycerate mutase